MIEKTDNVYKKYICKSIGRTYKILPLYEEKNDGLSKYIQSLIFELNGLPYVVKGILDDDYIVILATLESIYDESIVFSNDEELFKESLSIVRREVLKCLNILEKISESLSGDSK